jgi:hypothetical protein
MGILRPISIRSRGSWSVVGGGTALQRLTDQDDDTGVLLNPAVVNNGAVLRLQAGGFPAVGNFTLNIRGRRIGDPLSVEYGIAIGDPGDGELSIITREEIAVPNTLSTLSKVWDSIGQSLLNDIDNVWFAIRVLSAGTSQFGISEISLTVEDDPVGSWNSDLHATPVDTLVWCSMGDGRCRKGKLINGEWYDESGSPLELDASNFEENEDGDREASRWVTGWGSI